MFVVFFAREQPVALNVTTNQLDCEGSSDRTEDCEGVHALLNTTKQSQFWTAVRAALNVNIANGNRVSRN
ncbi:MAG: hypothetical protein HYZ09_02480 [Candidatus Kerfeldbacteria bacterium]|nr:hypothetical protein [Candidatus Kerfeldbacteria bacterium]